MSASAARWTARSCAGGQPVSAAALSDAILTDFVEQCLVADLEQHGCLFSIPIGLFQSSGNGFRFGFVFGVASERLQTTRAASGLSTGNHRSAGGIHVETIAAIRLGLKFSDRQGFVSQHEIALHEIT